MSNYPPSKRRKPLPDVINPIGEFCLPVTLPDDRQWVAAYIGAVRKLSNRSTWDYDAAGDYIAVADRWQEIANEIQASYANGISCEAEICEDGSCTQIGAFHPALTYYPNNPITQPDHEGPYASPVWGTGAGYIGATGSDAMIDVFAMVGQTIESILAGGIAPKIELAFDGDGEIDVQFLATIQGGLVWMYPDQNPLLGDLVNLQYTDVLSLLGVSTLASLFEVVIQQDTEAFVLTHSFKFETPGPHTLSMIFFPSVELEPPFLGAGGGLRSIQLCGNATVSEETVTAYTLELDGDSLNLMADGVPVSEVPKATLQSFLDRWIDNDPASAIEQFNGTLYRRPDPATSIFEILRTATIASLFQQDYQAATNAMTYRIRDAYALRFVSEAGKGSLWIRNQHVLLGTKTNIPSQTRGGVQIYTTVDPALSIEQRTAGADMVRFYDDADKVRAVLIGAGVWKATGLEGWDYSSTGTWRQQYALSGEWISSVDATRRGMVALHVSGYDGNYEILRAEYGDSIITPPKFAVLAGDGSSPRQMTYHGQVSARLDEALLELQKYGFLGDYVAGTQPPAVPDEIDLNRCFAAYYVADRLTTVISDLFTDMQTVTAQEFVDNIADAFNLDGHAEQNIVYSAFQAAYADRVGIVAEITDAAVIAEALIADFSLQGFLDFLGTYAWALGQTPIFLEDLVTNIWDAQVWRWAGRGIVVQYGPCGSEQYKLPCANANYDFRWNTAHGWEIDEGYFEFTEGVRDELNDGDWSVRMYGYFDSCRIYAIEIDYHCQGGTDQLLEIRGATSDGMGGYDEMPLPWSHTMTVGYGTFRQEFAGGIVFDRVLVRLIEWPSQRNNIVQKIRIETEE